MLSNVRYLVGITHFLWSEAYGFHLRHEFYAVHTTSTVAFNKAFVFIRSGNHATYSMKITRENVIAVACVVKQITRAPFIRSTIENPMLK